MTFPDDNLPVTAWTNCRVWTAVPGQRLIADGLIITRGGLIDYAGPMDGIELPPQAERIDLARRLVTSALIDCHTHIVHGGNRAREFEMRLEGASYVEIAQAGGGIMSTVSATRGRDLEALIGEALPRLDALLSEGVSTVEVKSGYGLT